MAQEKRPQSADQRERTHLPAAAVCAQALRLGADRSRCVRFTPGVAPVWLGTATTLNINVLGA